MVVQRPPRNQRALTSDGAHGAAGEAGWEDLEVSGADEVTCRQALVSVRPPVERHIGIGILNRGPHAASLQPLDSFDRPPGHPALEMARRQKVGGLPRAGEHAEWYG